MPQKHYTPPLSRFNVCALYHEAKQLGIPMTQLANNLVEAGLKESAGWKEGTKKRCDWGRGSKNTRPSNSHRNHITRAQSSPIEPCSFSASTHQQTKNERTNMITLECNYSKKLGLPGYSSHQFAITLRTEIADLNQVQAESARLYKLLQEGVDTSIKETGYLPTNGNGNGQRGRQRQRQQRQQPAQPRMVPGTAPANSGTSSSRSSRSTSWRRPRSRRLAQDRFGKTVKALNKLEASGLIEELLEQTGQSKGNGRRRLVCRKQVRDDCLSLNLQQVHSPAPTDRPTPSRPCRRPYLHPGSNAGSQCRLKFYFRYVQQISKPKTPALHVGSVVHLILQAWNMARWRKQAFQLERFKKLFEEGWKDQPPGINWDGEEDGAKNTAWSVLEMYFTETPIKANEMPEAVEVPMETDLSKHGLPTLIGVLDLVRAGGRIVDFKTTGKTPRPRRCSSPERNPAVLLLGFVSRSNGAAGNQEGNCITWSKPRPRSWSSRNWAQ